MLRHLAEENNINVLQSDPLKPYVDFKLRESDFEFLQIAGGFRRAECILADKKGEFIYAAYAADDKLIDKRSGVMRVNLATKEYQLIGSEPTYCKNRPKGYEVDSPNGLAWYDNTHILIANFGLGVLEILDITNGHRRLLLETFKGKPLGHVNYVLVDRQGRIYLTVSTTEAEWINTINADTRNGRILLITGDIVNGGKYEIKELVNNLCFANEAHFSPDEKKLIVAETCGCHLSYFDIVENTDGITLGEKKRFGPENLGGLPDGFAIDELGNAIVTLVHSDKIIAIAQDKQEIITLFDSGNQHEQEKIIKAFNSKENILSQQEILELLGSAGWKKAPAITSINFVPDANGKLTHVVIGNLFGTVIPRVKKPFPVPGLAPYWF